MTAKRGPSRYIGSFSESSFPVLEGFVVFVFCDCFTVTATTLPYVRWIYLVEDGCDYQSLSFSAVQYLHQFFQAPFWLSIVFGEYHDGKVWVLDCLAQWRPNLLSFLKVMVIRVCFDVGSRESRTKMANERGADVLTSEADENIVLLRTWWWHDVFRHCTSFLGLGGLQIVITIQLHNHKWIPQLFYRFFFHILRQ